MIELGAFLLGKGEVDTVVQAPILRQGVRLPRIDIPAVDALAAVSQKLLLDITRPITELLHARIRIIGIIQPDIHPPTCRIVEVEVMHLLVSLPDIGRLRQSARRVFNRLDIGSDSRRIGQVQVVILCNLIIQGSADVVGHLSPQAGVVLHYVMHHAAQRMVGDEIVPCLPFDIICRIKHICRHLPPHERKVQAAVTLRIFTLRKTCSDLPTHKGFFRLSVFQHQVDDCPSHTIFGWCAVHHFRLLHMADWRTLQQTDQLCA